MTRSQNTLQYIAILAVSIDLSCLLGLLDEVRTLLLEGQSEFYYRCPAFAMPQ